MLQVEYEREECVDHNVNLPKRGKQFFLRTVAGVVAEVNRQLEYDGLTYDHKVMIINGLALDTNGRWE